MDIVQLGKCIKGEAMTVGEIIKNYRSEKGVPAGTVADALDMSVREYLTVEGGAGEFSEEDISAIADLLGITPEDITEGEEIFVPIAKDEIRFVNSYMRTREHIEGISAYCTFKRPFSVALMVLFSFIFAASAIALFFAFNPFLIVGLVYAPLHIVMQFSTYRRFVKMLVARDKEATGGDLASFEITVTDSEIVCNNSAGNITRIKYNGIKKIVAYKNYLFITTVQGKIYTMERDCFTVGDAQGFIDFAREKGIRV